MRVSKLPAITVSTGLIALARPESRPETCGVSAGEQVAGSVRSGERGETLAVCRRRLISVAKGVPLIRRRVNPSGGGLLTAFTPTCENKRRIGAITRSRAADPWTGPDSDRLFIAFPSQSPSLSLGSSCLSSHAAGSLRYRLGKVVF
ncbi:hypothetical protein AAFF_G00093790 [Aldrovandia affinis]|uniref:Uncharacterized protein n=1 Tax=Aldrovandia affinis TaxID=143900 RepID=A0AAD7WY89_9TELE|nr:hypothetical protein AAFF_G00093790 [Aldrovandia affinis]